MSTMLPHVLGQDFVTIARMARATAESETATFAAGKNIQHVISTSLISK